MNNPSFFNARFLLPVCAVFIIIGVVTSYQSDDKNENINGTGAASASAVDENTIELQEAIDVALRAEATTTAAELKAKAAADKLAAAAQAEADAAEQKAKAEFVQRDLK